MNLILLLMLLISSGYIDIGELEEIKVEVNNFEIVDVTLKASDGITIKGTYYNTSNENASGVILLHMLSRNRGDWREFARYLQASDYRVLAIDLRGHGESDLNWRKFSPHAEFNDMVLDVATAKEFLVQKGVKSTDIAIIGGSIGSNVAINYAAEDEDIRGVVLLSPGLDYRGVKTEEAMTAYGERPVFIIASEGDVYSADSSRILHSRAKGDSKLNIYPSDAHGTWIIQSQNSSDMIIEWLKEVL
jgi:pimeloyl-ACP methyl ester carboxylesterase